MFIKNLYNPVLVPSLWNFEHAYPSFQAIRSRLHHGSCQQILYWKQDAGRAACITAASKECVFGIICRSSQNRRLCVVGSRWPVESRSTAALGQSLLLQKRPGHMFFDHGVWVRKFFAKCCNNGRVFGRIAEGNRNISEPATMANSSNR